jgi:hypothetical protein
VPTGDTALAADDLIVALTGDPDALRDLLRRSSTPVSGADTRIDSATEEPE